MRQTCTKFDLYNKGRMIEMPKTKEKITNMQIMIRK